MEYLSGSGSSGSSNNNSQVSNNSHGSNSSSSNNKKSKSISGPIGPSRPHEHLNNVPNPTHDDSTNATATSGQSADGSLLQGGDHVWIAPKNQKGDGKTWLNEKLGY